ncbi:MAG: flavodoxin family protein [Phycisphaerales bacterium JB061]
MAKIAIVYHSGFGHTKVVAECIARGAQEVGGTAVSVVSAEELPDPEGESMGGRWDELQDADCIVFGCPTYMGSVTAEMKRVFEASSKFWFAQKWRDKLAAGFTNAAATSGDKLNTLQDIFHFCMQHSMLWVSQGVMYGGDGENDINRMGSYMGCMAQSGDDSPEVTPPPGDRQTAELFGKRLAELAHRYTSGDRS